MKVKHIYVCDGTIDGIFTAIYDAWSSRYGHSNIAIIERDSLDEYELFSEYIESTADFDKSMKIAASIQKKISLMAYQSILCCALSNRKGRSDIIYRFMQIGYAMGPSVTNQLSHPYVLPVFEIERRVNNEVHHYKEFLRFSELNNQILFSKIRPENDILSMVSPHFEDRLPEENWIIYDVGRKKASIHRKRYPFVLVDGSELDLSQADQYTETEWDMQFLWQQFVDTIGIQERFNEKLQLNMLPNRYREFMREMPYKERK